jgi:hypothetical protein
MSKFSFIVFTDAHVTAVDGETDSPFQVNSASNSRFSEAIKMMNQLDADFALNLGDMVHPLPGTPDYNTASKRYFEITGDLRHQHYNIPGNHDIGDKPSNWMPAADISSNSISQYKSCFGDDYSSFDHKGWRFILLNAELFNSALEENNKQKRWLEGQLGTAPIGKTVIAVHYPPFLYSPDEVDHYDNLGPADRRWLLEIFRDCRVPIVLSGHVHNFWYNTFAETKLLVVPSTSFVRQDYSEMYSCPSPLEGGRDDINKLGFFRIEIDEDNVSWRFYRTFGGEDRTQGLRPVSHRPKDRRNVSFGADMRVPWITHHEIPPSGALDEFYRKQVRNDYPLLAVYELGINRLRLPLEDLLNSQTRNRLLEIKNLGLEYTFYCLDTSAQDLKSLDVSAINLIDALEIVSCVSDSETVHKMTEQIRGILKCKLLFSPLLNTYGACDEFGRHLHIIQHGFTPDTLNDLSKQIDATENLDELIEGFDGLVCRLDLVSASKSDWDQIAEWAAKNSTELHILTSCKSSSPANIFDDEELLTEKLKALWYQASSMPDHVTFFSDSLIDVDRGYFRRAGIIDRLGNPRKAWHMLMRA